MNKIQNKHTRAANAFDSVATLLKALLCWNKASLDCFALMVMAVLRKSHRIIGAGQIRALLMEREFIGSKWLGFLEAQGIG